MKEAQRAVLLGGTLRLPLDAALHRLGSGVSSSLAGKFALARAKMVGEKPDLLVPMFILEFVPTGLKGLAFGGHGGGGDVEFGFGAQCPCRR